MLPLGATPSRSAAACDDGVVSEFIAERLWPDARVERSIFGTDDPPTIWQHVRTLCPEAVDCFAFHVSVGALFGLRLADGSRIALKVHKEQAPEFLDAVQAVQQHLSAAGFPCPRPLGRRGRATLEEWRDEGEARDAHEPEVRQAMARLLVRLIRSTEGLDQPPALQRSFFPGRQALWPTPHNVLFDFEATAEGAEWIDELARAAKPARDLGVGRIVIAHNDWSTKHVRWNGLEPAVVYDWDRLSTGREPRFVGGAAHAFTYTEELPGALWASAAEAAAFIDEYEEERGEPFTADERRVAEASAVYSRAYAARCGHAVGAGPAPGMLDDYVEAFLRAGPRPEYRKPLRRSSE